VWLTRFAITRPVITAMIFIGLAVYGVMSYFSLGVSLFPNVAFPAVFIYAGYPGASPSEMEKLVIKPIEDQLDGMENMDLMRAYAQEGSALVVARFKLDTDLNYETIDVQRRVDTARVYMPTDLDPPQVFKESTATDPILEVAITSRKLTSAAMSDLITNRLVPDLKAVPGVQTVDTAGEAAREIHVYPDESRLVGTSVTLTDIAQALSYNNSNLPGGRMDAPTQETTVSVHADIVAPQDILRIPLTLSSSIANAAAGPTNQAAAQLHVGDVAGVEDGHVEQRRPSHYNGLPSVLLQIQRQNNADEVKTTQSVRNTLVTMRSRYPDVIFSEITASADYTRASINGVLQSLGEGILLTAIVMLLFLHAWRNALVVMISIPCSLLATFIVMNLMGFTVDLISMMGLGLTIGILVDDSIVVLENITRHRDMGEKPLDAAYLGRTEIGQAAITITLVDVVVFLPIAFLSGIVGKYMKEFGIVIVVATLFSLLVSFTLTPLLAGRWSVKRRSPAVPVWAAWFQTAFERVGHWYSNVVLPWALAHRILVPVGCALLILDALTLVVNPAFAFWFNAFLTVVAFAVFGLVLAFTYLRMQPRSLTRAFFAARPLTVGVMALYLLGVSALFAPWPTIGKEFIPSSDTGVLQGSLSYHIGQPLPVTVRGLDRLVTQLLKIDGVQSVLSTAGAKRSGFSSTTGGHVAQFTVILDKKRRKETNRVLADARKLGWTVPGADYQITTEGGGGGGAAIAFTLTGPDAELDQAANKLVAFIKQQPGAVNVQSAAELEAPRLNIRIDPLRAAVLGIQPADAATTARIAIGGIVATRVRLESGLTDVRLELPYAERNSFSTIEQLRVRAANGMMVPLASLADFSWTLAPTKIERLNKERVIRVTGDVDPTQRASLGAILDPVTKAVNAPGFLPAGVHYILEGDSDLYDQTFKSMGLALLTSFVLVYMLMVVLYGSFLEPFVVMFSVPVAIVGALFGLAVHHQSLNLFSLIAIVMLFGLVSKNGILLVDYANQQRRNHGFDVFEAMKSAAAVRFRPILMTTFAMIFGMLPLSLGLTEGAEERASMGTVLIGGLLSSLVLTLVLVPVMYTWIMGGVDARQRRKAARRAVEEEHNLEPGEALPAH